MTVETMNSLTSLPRVSLPSKQEGVPIAEDDRPPLIQQYIRVALRWRYVILGAAVTCLLIGLIITLLMTPRYTAVTTVEIARESSKITGIEGVEREATVNDQEFYQTQYGLLRSRVLAERVANKLQLVDDPVFFERFDAVRDTPAFAVAGKRYSPRGRAERQRLADEA